MLAFFATMEERFGTNVHVLTGAASGRDQSHITPAVFDIENATANGNPSRKRRWKPWHSAA